VAFSLCMSLTAITVAANNPAYSSVAGVLFNQSQTTLIQFPGGNAGSYVVPNSVTSIGDEAFNGCMGLTSVTIPNSVTSIGDGAFSDCTSLISVTFGTNVTSIGDDAFGGCARLTSVTIPNSVTNIGDWAFLNCIRLTAITVATNNPAYSSVDGVLFNQSQTTLIQFPGGNAGSYMVPNSVTSIGDGAFCCCMGLTSVTIPNSVTSIGYEAFYICQSLGSVTIGNSVTNIGYLAFADCTNLMGVYFNGNAPSLGSEVFDGDNNTTFYYLPGTTGWADFSAITGVPTVELTGPMLAITAPTAGQQVSNANYTITGTTADTVAVTNVFYALNNSGWTPATTANHWTNWSASVTLIPGTNSIAAYAVDTNGSFSLTKSVSLDYVLNTVLTVRTNGHGTISPNYNGAMLQIGQSYTMTATASPGYGFTGWTGSSITNGATLIFVMASNLTFTANFVFVTNPTLTVTAPVSGQRWSNALFTVTGTARDNLQVSNVVCQVNGGVWSNAATVNLWTNWTAAVNLIPGTNTVAAYAVDTTGYVSTTNGVSFQYVVTNQLQIRAIGLGTISPNYSNAWLETGRNYSITSAPASGFVFTNWVISTNWIGGTIVTKTNLQFMMASNLTLQVNFADVTKPTLSITNLTAGQRVSNAVFTVQGTASDNWQMSNVVCQINGGAWSNAATANLWTNWTAAVNLIPGTNTVAAYAVDTSGNISTTNSVSFQFVLTNQLQIRAIGLGTISPNYSNAWLNIGQNYSITSAPASGFVFTNWIISTNWVGGTTLNKTNLQFMMASNLTLQVTFADVTKPTVSITNLASGQRVSNAVFTVKGTASDNWQVSNVVCQLNGGAWSNAATANLWTNWTAAENLIPGTNTIAAYAVDTSGNISTTGSVSFQFVATNQLQIRVNGLGTISPNYSNAWLEIGRNYSITSTPAAGFVFTNWVVSTNWIGGVTTTKTNLTFMMASNLTLQVTFLDVTKPTLTITAPTAGQHMTNALATIVGTASDNWKVSAVWYQLTNKILTSGPWSLATTTNNYTNWTTTVTLAAGTNTVKAYAVDLGGNDSTTSSVSVLSSNTFKLQLNFTLPQPLTSSGLNFTLQISSNLNGHIQVSTNLTSWAPLTNFVGTNTTLNFRDATATNFNWRFYRAVVP
jgi:uncharacterized repeat protein (TIGR02543 family)